jgi:thymidylate kinase
MGGAMSHTAPQLVLQYFRELKARGIRAVILHDFEGLPERWTTDIDYAVPRDALARLPAIQRAVAQAAGWRVTRNISANLDSDFAVLFRDGHPGEFIQFDASADFVHSRCWIAPADELLRDAGERDPFLTAAPAAEFTYLLGKSLAKQRPVERVLARMRSLAAADPAGCEQAFERLLDGKAGDLTDWLPREAQAWDELGPGLRRRRRFGLGLMLREAFRLARRWWRPHGVKIAILGPDGTGKSTLIAALTKAIGPRFRSVDYVHFRPGLLDGKTGGPPVTDPHGKPPRSWPAGVAKTFFYFLDQWAGHLARIRPALVRNRLVIFDRDFHDLLLDTRRYRLRGVRWLVRLLAPLAPRADLTLGLHAPAAVIHARKPELPVAELERQMDVLRKLASGCRNWHLLDAGAPPEAVLQEALRVVLARLESAQ